MEDKCTLTTEELLAKCQNLISNKNKDSDILFSELINRFKMHEYILNLYMPGIASILANPKKYKISD